jgi:hypothetical protein
MCRHIIRRRLKPLQQLFSICDNVLVLEDGAIVLKVDRGRLLRECTVDTLSICVALSERLEGRYGLFGLFVCILAIFMGDISRVGQTFAET